MIKEDSSELSMRNRKCNDATEGKPTNITYSKDLLNVGSSNFESKLLLKQKKTYKASPSSVLQSVKDFLPMMASANRNLQDQLEHSAREEFDIENVENHTGPLIEMDLAIFQENSDSDDSDSDFDLDSEEEKKNINGLSCSSDDSDNDESDINFGEITEKSFKISKPHSKRPDIEEMNTESCEQSDVTSNR
ncbi:uncharacterized protein LOC144453530 [Glandiceps talaboti]